MDFSHDRYKLSRYNVFHNDGDVRYMWNTYSNALVKLDEQSQIYMQKFDKHPRVDDETDEFTLLKDNGFIVYEKIDELGRVKFFEKHTLFSVHNPKMALVIAPGMDCNYKCTYCFESQSDRTAEMSLETAEKVIE